MIRAWSFILGTMVATAACGGASSQPLTPDPDPAPSDQDIAALQNAQTSIADGEDGGATAVPATPSGATTPKTPATAKKH